MRITSEALKFLHDMLIKGEQDRMLDAVQLTRQVNEQKEGTDSGSDQSQSSMHPVRLLMTDAQMQRLMMLPCPATALRLESHLDAGAP